MVIIWVVKIFFVQFFCVFLPPLNIFCFCWVHTISVLYWAHHCMKCSFGISKFLEEISSLSHTIVFLYFFSLITEEDFLISPWYSLELCIQIMPYKASNSLFTFPSLHPYHALANKLVYSIVHLFDPAVMTIYLFDWITFIPIDLTSVARLLPGASIHGSLQGRNKQIGTLPRPGSQRSLYMVAKMLRKKDSNWVQVVLRPLLVPSCPG